MRIRIGLYATLALATSALPSSAQRQAGDFTFVPRLDGTVDGDRSYLSTDAKGTTFSVLPTLFWRCGPGASIELAVLVDELQGTEGLVSVQWRFDAEAPDDPLSWPLSGDGSALFAPDRDRDVFTRRALDADEVLLRVMDRGRSWDSRFGLAGLSDGLDLLGCRSALRDPDAPPELDPVEVLPTELRGLLDAPFTEAPQILNPEEMVRHMEREYPDHLRRARIGGTVRVFVFVSESGRVVQARIDETSGRPELDEAALRVAGRYRFRPARKDGEPVGVWVSFPVNFEVR